MVIFSRNTLFCLALGGLVSTTAWSQEPVPAPAEQNPPVPAAAEATADSIMDRPGVIHVSDCPPEDFGAYGGGSQKWKCREHVPPHAGWNPPGRRPMYRSWVPYHKFFPNSWTGNPAPRVQHRAPTVYMPTDTTQLGYYYQHVPTWHSYQGMLPPVPRPADWHYVYREPRYNTYPTHVRGYPTVAPEPVTPDQPTETPAPVPDESSLDRSAAVPDLVPIPQ